MVSSEVLGRLEERAALAENLIDVLTKQLAQLQAACLVTRKEQLRKSNEQLRLQVNNFKNQLVDLETQNGIKQFYDFKKAIQPIVEAPVPVDSTPPPAEKKVEAPVPVTSTPPPAEKKEKTKKEKKTGGGGGGAKKAEIPDAPVDVARLDFRVGRIVCAKKHPDADSLYVEEVDIGEGKMRTVVSGLVRFVPEEEMQNRMVVLLCNLKPAKMRGVTSEAMVMCASTPEKVEILLPPPGCEPGDKIEFEGYTRNPDAILNPKKKVFETCVPDLKTNDSKVACYKGIPFTVSGKGEVVSPSLCEVQIK